MRRRTWGRQCGKKTRSHFSMWFLFYPGKWDVFLPYVHLPQLTAHIRKGLLKRGNNEKKRDWKLCGAPLLSPFGRNILSAGTKRSSLPGFHQDLWGNGRNQCRNQNGVGLDAEGIGFLRTWTSTERWNLVFKFSEWKDATDPFSCSALIF